MTQLGALLHEAVCNPRTCLLPWITRRKTCRWPVKIQPSSASPWDTHVVTLVSDLRPRRIIGPARRIHSAVMCGELHVYVRCEIMIAGKKRLKEASASSAMGLPLRIILSLGGVELIHVNQGSGPSPFSGKSGQRRCQHSAPNGQMPTANRPPPHSSANLSALMNARPGLSWRLRNWSHDYEFIWVFRGVTSPGCLCFWWRMGSVAWWFFRW